MTAVTRSLCTQASALQSATFKRVGRSLVEPFLGSMGASRQWSLRAACWASPRLPHVFPSLCGDCHIFFGRSQDDVIIIVLERCEERRRYEAQFLELYEVVVVLLDYWLLDSWCRRGLGNPK